MSPSRTAARSTRAYETILPQFLARLNIVDFTRLDTFATGIHLTTAVRDGPAAPPLPDPLPPEPPIPLSYLAELGDLVRAETLSLRDQMAAAAMLRDALSRPEDHEDALVLIRAFADREDLYVRVHAQIQDLVIAVRRPGDRRGLFSPARAELRRTLTGHTATIWELAHSPDGTLLATASDDQTARLWDAATGAHIRTLTGHTSGVGAVAFSPDGTLLATASYDTTARLWDPATGEHIRTLEGHSSFLCGAAFRPDGSLLATASCDTTVRDPARHRQRRQDGPAVEPEQRRTRPHA